VDSLEIVELRGRLSNPQAREIVTLAAQAFDNVAGENAQTGLPRSVTRRWRVIDRLGHQVISELLADRHAGATKPALAARYGISVSSVKRILKREG
jgi:hypothetical protein